MKHIKIYEEFKKNSLTLKQIEWLDSVVFGNWSVNAEGKIDVKGKVNAAYNDSLVVIPVQFGSVSESFDVEGCKFLKSLMGSPRIVGTFFDCTHCSSLTTLAGAPEKIGTKFWHEFCRNVPDEEDELAEENLELFLQWANSGMKLEDFLHKKRGTFKGKEFGF